MGDIIGLIALAGLIGLVSLFVPASAVPPVMWVFIYLVWMMGALFIWHHRNAPEKPQTWLVLALCSGVAASIWSGIANLAASVAVGAHEPGLSKVFDLIVTSIFSPGLTFIAVTGWIRALMVARLK
jgi:tryptophan-rich sensory protein